MIIVGAGPAGLTAAHELVQLGHMPLVLEQDKQVGGISRTEVFKGYRFDIGGHRFYTNVDAINRLWHTVLGKDFHPVPRLSRIYYRSKFYHYPLDPLNVLQNLGVGEGTRIVASYARARLNPSPTEHSFEDWVINRFGRQLYQTFFKPYTEKVWGIPCHEIRADWAAQRIRGLSFVSALKQAMLKRSTLTTLIKEFHYPTYGPGQMWEQFAHLVKQGGGHIWLNTPVCGITWSDQRVQAVKIEQQGQIRELACEHLISSMPLSALIAQFDPPVPEEVSQAARSLRYRAFLTVGLIIDQAMLFPDNWLYIHSPHIRVGRIQNYKNWSVGMVPDQQKTSLGMEYFCDEGDELWTMSDADLIELATREVTSLGLCSRHTIEDGVVIRQPKAYPCYDTNYRQHLKVIQDFLATIENVQTIGRNGMHRYNNQDHSMLTGLLAARNLYDRHYDLWAVNTDRSYYEDFVYHKPHLEHQSWRCVPE